MGDRAAVLRAIALVLRMRRLSSAVAVCLGALACQPPGSEVPVEGESAALISGGDDRQEWFGVEDETLRQRIDGSSVALVYAHRLRISGGVPAVMGPTLGEARHLCPGERFREQPTGPFCSGTLIDRDLVLTAGHCLGSDEGVARAGCSRVRFVFGYRMEQPDQLAALRAGDLFSCRGIIVHEGGQASADSDFAVVQLDRPVGPERTPAPVRTSRPEVGEGVAVAGYGAGLPLKVEVAAEITGVAGPLRFLAATDTFGGASGSGAYDGERRLVGLHVSGNPDWTADGTCTRAAVVARAAEQNQIAASAIQALCRNGWPSPGLCGTAHVCGDGRCGPDERASCPGDCPPPACGDRLCEPSELGHCPADCAPYDDVPATWEDDPAIYPRMPPTDSAGGCAVAVGPPAPPGALLAAGLVLAFGLARLQSRRITARRQSQQTASAEMPPTTARHPPGCGAGRSSGGQAGPRIRRRLRWWVRSGWMRTASRPTKTSRQLSTLPFQRTSRVLTRRHERRKRRPSFSSKGRSSQTMTSARSLT